MLYCLQNKIRFILYSKNANFSPINGWKEFFLPFTDEGRYQWWNKLNTRQVTDSVRDRVLNSIKVGIKQIYGIDYTTSDVFLAARSFFFRDSNIYIPELSLLSAPEQGILTPMRELVSMIWRYNEETEVKVNELISLMGMKNGSYVGMHIRGGDKLVEAKLEDPLDYVKRSEQLSDIRNAFILTDDYDILLKLKETFPGWNFFSLCQSSENGYYHKDFIALPWAVKKIAFLRLFASVDMLGRADYCIGTVSSNVGQFLGMRMPQERFIDLEDNAWRIR